VECAPYPPPPLWTSNGEVNHTLTEGVRGRGDFEWARNIATLLLSDRDRRRLESLDSDNWHPGGWCELPVAELYVWSSM
jgi:hypothetical protein